MLIFKKIFSIPGKQICEASFLNERGSPFWADLQAASASSLRDKRKWCRVAISDLTTLKQAEEVRRRLEDVTAAAVASFILAYLVRVFVGMRPTPESGTTGLDLTDHQEEGYII